MSHNVPAWYYTYGGRLAILLNSDTFLPDSPTFPIDLGPPRWDASQHPVGAPTTVSFCTAQSIYIAVFHVCSHVYHATVTDEPRSAEHTHPEHTNASQLH